MELFSCIIFVVYGILHNVHNYIHTLQEYHPWPEHQ